MDEQPVSGETGEAETGSEDELKCRLLTDGTHQYPVVDVSIPAHGVNGNGTGQVTWHPEKGLQFEVEQVSDESPADLFAALDQLNRRTPRTRSAGAGAVIEPARDPQFAGRIAGTNAEIRLFQLHADDRSTSESGTAGFSSKTVVSGTAMAATVRVERDSDLSFWHETTGERRLLIPDLWIYQWPEKDKAEWQSGDTYHSAERFSCALSDDPKLTLYSASRLPHDRCACWLVFEPHLIPEGQPDWYTPDACLAAQSLLSFLAGKRLPFLWMDRLVDENYLTRTYYGAAKADDFRLAAQGYQPVPLNSLRHGGSVVGELPSLFASYLQLRKWYDLDWIVGPLWYATTAYLDDKLGLASVSIERFATSHSAFLTDNPDKKPPRIRFLTRAQFRSLRGELVDSIEAFAKEQGIDLDASRAADVASIIENAVDAISRLDDSLFPEEKVESVRSTMREAVERANKDCKLQLDETKMQIIGKRIDSFAQKTNPDKLIEAIEFDGLSVSDEELETIMKRNDCLHGRRTLTDGGNLANIAEEVARFDTLRTLIAKAMLARLGYRSLYVDYSTRPPQAEFPVRNLGEEIQANSTEEQVD